MAGEQRLHLGVASCLSPEQPVLGGSEAAHWLLLLAVNVLDGTSLQQEAASSTWKACGVTWHLQ